MGTKLERIADISAHMPRPEFTSLYHLIDAEMLKQCHKELDGSKAVGMSYLKGKSTLMLFDRHPEYRERRGNKHFWARGYYVSTVGNVNEETIREYIRNQEENDKLEDN